MDNQKNKVLLGDCLELMKDIPDASIDMILCDLPYGTTACKWDTIISFDKLWEQYERIIKPNGAIVLTASQPFTSALVMSNPKLFKFAVAKYQPLKEHENILVFCKGKTIYNPIKEERKGSGKARLKNGYKSNGTSTEVYGGLQSNRKGKEYEDLKYPSSVQYFNNRDKDRGMHPTQKPTALFEYLIKTYTNENDLVLDNCAGSGTLGVACLNTNRNYILIEKEQKYFDIINERIEKHKLL
jgi:site-specific DNA-methyltransferase (adenine-specific)